VAILTLEAIGPDAEELLFEALAGIDPDWETRLRVAD
jgi:hypothetical protein